MNIDFAIVYKKISYMKNVLITAANKGIGFETAKQLAQLAATDLNDFKGTKSVQEGVKPIVRLVTSNSEYVTGEFLKEGGTVPW